MFRLTRLVTFRSIRLHLLRFSLSGFGIVLGVAAMLAINVTNRTALTSIEELFQSTSGNAKLTITSADSESSQGFPEQIRLKVGNTAGVSLSVPLVKAQTMLSQDATPEQLTLGMFGTSIAGELQLFGIDPAMDQKIRSYKQVDGHFLSDDPSAREIVLVDEYAEDKEVEIDEWIGVLTPNGVEQLKIVGLIAKDGAGQTNNGDFGVLPLGTAQELFNRDGYLDQVDILTSETNPNTQALEALKDTLQSRLGMEYTVSFPANQGERMTQMLQNYQIGLNFMSGIALFVGAFLIYNAFAMTVIERTREFGLLRTIGMTRGQVTAQMLLEAAILGVFGSILGLALGVLLARGMTSLMGLILNQPLREIKFPLDMVFSSFLVGLVVTFLAAGLPALQAGRISPMEALRIRGKTREGWLIRTGWVFGILLLAGSIAILIWNPFPYDVQFRMGSLTVFGLFAGATLLIPATVGAWERIGRPLLTAIYGSSGSLGSRNVQRSRQRTTLTVAALMIGVAMVIMTRSMTQSFAGDLRSWMEAYLGGDIYVGASVPLRGDMGTRIELVPGVEAVAPVRYFNVDLKTPDGEIQTINFMAYDPLSYSQVTDFVFSGSQPSEEQVVKLLMAGDSVLLSSVLAEKHALAAGDSLLLRTRSGYRTFTIAAVVVDFYNQGLVVQGSWDDMRRYFRINDASTFMVKVSEDYQVADVQQTIEDLYKKRYSLILESNESLRKRALTLMAQAFSMFDVMALIAVLVGSLGVINTLTMSVIERTQEIGMLRAIGMTRGQVVAMVLAEAGLMGLFGGALGLLTGILLARILFYGMTAMSGYQLTFVMPIDGVVLTFVVAFIISQLAAIFPGRRASRIKILEAVHYE
jgi:putative ABC transport system permease protein